MALEFFVNIRNTKLKFDKPMKTGLYFSFSAIFLRSEGYLGHN